MHNQDLKEGDEVVHTMYGKGVLMSCKDPDYVEFVSEEGERIYAYREKIYKLK